MRALIAVALGGALGCVLRWGLGNALNSTFPAIPPGTLAANIIGAYVIGVAIAICATSSALSPEWRLFIVTGFCGGLTTFSTFSAEVVALLQHGRLLLAFAATALHVGTSLIMTFAGIATVSWLKA